METGFNLILNKVKNITFFFPQNSKHFQMDLKDVDELFKKIFELNIDTNILNKEELSEDFFLFSKLSFSPKVFSSSGKVGKHIHKSSCAPCHDTNRFR